MPVSVTQLRKKIIAAANKDELGWFEYFDKESGKTIRLARRPLLWYAFHRASRTGFNLPAYKPLSPLGMKMGYDDKYHTDAWLSAGFDLKNAYDSESWEHKAFFKAVWKFKEENEDLIKCDFIILAKGRKARGRVFGDVLDARKDESHHTRHIMYDSRSENKSEWERKKLKIIVVPHAGPEYDLEARRADVVITETGGKLCHLATVMRETGKTLLMIGNATKRFNHFTSLWIDFDNSTLKCSD